MKRIAVSAGMLVLIAFALAAAVWDGSAVAGVAEDFPGDGLFATCNSFPRDTSVTVTNLENGKTVTVTVTGGVANPGVFIALSPKAAAALDMRAGSAARIRAVALTASQAEATLPPARAGESADPDYNPRVYVEREKAAVAAAAANAASTAQAPEAVAPAAAANISAAPSVTAPAATVAPAPATPSATPVPPTAAATTPPPAAPNAAPPAAVAQAPSTAAAPAATPRAEALPLPEASPVFPGSPKPGPLGMTLPSPDLPTIPATVPPKPYLGYLAQAPEILGGAIPQPRKPAVPRLAVTEPAIPGTAAAVAPAATTIVPKPPEKATVTALARPSPYPPALALRLPEPPAFGPEELPEAILDRITSPSKLAPVPVLAEANPPSAIASNAGLEVIALERPSYAAEVEAAALAEATPLLPSEAVGVAKPSKTGGYVTLSLDEAALPGYPEIIADIAPAKNRAAPEASVALDEAAPPGEPEAIAYRRTVVPNSGLAELQNPDVPTPQESFEAGRPNAVAPSQAIAELAEPSLVSPTAGPESAVALSAEKPALAASPSAELATPAVPSPSESIGGENPATPKPGEAIVELQPAELRPPKAAATPSQPPAVAMITGPTPSAAAAMPPASVPMIKGLSKGSFYVQIGVFSTNDSLQSAIADFKSTYPLAVESLTTKAGNAAYRLFVGPLSRDEGGIVLIRMRSLGFKDAYIRQGT